MKNTNAEIQYTVVDKRNGIVVDFCVDSEEAPLVAKSLKALLRKIEDWADTTTSAAALEDIEKEGLTIVKQEIKTIPFNMNELAYLEKKKKVGQED